MKADSQNLQTNRQKFARSLILILFVFLFSPFFNLTSLNMILGLIIITITYVFFREYIWVLLALSAPSLVFGRFIYFQINPSWIYEISLAEIFLIVSATVFFIDIFINARLNKIRANSLAVILFLYFLASFLFAWQIIDQRLYIFGLKVVVFSFLAYFLSYNLLTDRKKIFWFIYGLSATAFILSLQIFYKFNAMGWSSRFFFDRSNILILIGPVATTAAILALILPVILSLYFYNSTNIKAKPYLLIFFVLGSLALFLTLGKAAILSLLAGLFYLFLKIKDKRIVFIISIIFFISLSYLFFSSFFQGLFERLRSVLIDSNTKFRIDEYRAGWKLIRNNFLFGVGSGQQLVYYAKMMNMETGKMVNNFFLQAFIDLGIFGLTLAAAAVISIFRKTKNILKNIQGRKIIIAYGFTASLIAAFLNGLAEVTIFGIEYAIIFWLLVGAFNNLNNQNENFSHHNQL